MRSALVKVGVGLAALLASLVLWWTVEQNAYGDHTLAPTDVPWDDFPVVLGGEEDVPVASAEDSVAGMVIFVYGPHDCYTNREAMDSWHAAAAQVETVESLNVLLERGPTAARRYLSEFTTPYPTRLDATGWFRSELELIDTPAVVLLAEDGIGHVIYPTQSALTDIDRQRYINQIRNIDKL